MAQPVFGYGSNSVRQLRGRLEDQRLVGYPARIRGQALAFCGPNRSWSEGSEVVGTATLIPSEEHTALGTVTFMSSEQIAMLDTYEGQDVPLFRLVFEWWWLVGVVEGGLTSSTAVLSCFHGTTTGVSGLCRSKSSMSRRSLCLPAEDLRSAGLQILS